MQLSLIIPIYRQEKTIVENVKHIQAALEKTRFTYEIICVVDGYVDKSFELLQQANLDHTRIHGYEKNHGKSYAIRYGMERAQGEYVMLWTRGWR